MAVVGVVLTSLSVDAAEQHSAGDWHFVLTANPHNAGDSASISHIADVTRSDLDLAGVMVRCSKMGVDVMIVLIVPFPRHVHPSVAIIADGKESRFDVSVLPPGAELLLPAEAARLAGGLWQSASELSVTVSSAGRSFGGVIPIDGLSSAFGKLVANCPTG